MVRETGCKFLALWFEQVFRRVFQCDVTLTGPANETVRFVPFWIHDMDHSYMQDFFKQWMYMIMKRLHDQLGNRRCNVILCECYFEKHWLHCIFHLQSYGSLPSISSTIST